MYMEVSSLERTSVFSMGARYWKGLCYGHFKMD